MFYLVLGLLIVSLVFGRFKMRKMCMVLISIIGLNYIANIVVSLTMPYALLQAVAGNGIPVYQIIISLLLIFALVFIWKKDFSKAMWLISITLTIHILGHWNIWLTDFFTLIMYLKSM